MSSSKNFDKEFIRDLAQMLSDCDLTEIELEYDKARLRVCREVKQTIITQAPQAYPAQSAAPVAMDQNIAEDKAPSLPAGEVIKSPMVGTVYLAPDPESSPFIQLGAQVNKGDVILIVEAMKVMNNIPSPKSGTIKAILVSDKQAVEFAQPLIIIE